MNLLQRQHNILAPLAAWLTVTALWIFSGTQTAAYQSTGSAVARIEEDWELIVAEPTTERAGPQVSTQMARSQTAHRFCNFHLNSLDVPSYRQGGLQLQVWRGVDNIGITNSTSSEVLNTPNERITWTQYLDLSSGSLSFGISAASSQTWGDFSGLSVAVSGSAGSLDNYDPDYSKFNSGVTFGANRVNSMTLYCVRKIHADGSVETDATLRAVYPADPATIPPLGGGSTGN